MNIDPHDLGFIVPTLGELLNWAESTTGLMFNTTSIYRPGDPGVHGQLPVRGYDVRCRVGSIGRAIADHVNAVWSYDPARLTLKCCLYHDVGRGAHLHFQVHPNTERRA